MDIELTLQVGQGLFADKCIITGFYKNLTFLLRQESNKSLVCLVAII